MALALGMTPHAMRQQLHIICGALAVRSFGPELLLAAHLTGLVLIAPSDEPPYVLTPEQQLTAELLAAGVGAIEIAKTLGNTWRGRGPRTFASKRIAPLFEITETPRGRGFDVLLAAKLISRGNLPGTAVPLWYDEPDSATRELSIPDELDTDTDTDTDTETETKTRRPQRAGYVGRQKQSTIREKLARLASEKRANGKVHKPRELLPVIQCKTWKLVGKRMRQCENRVRGASHCPEHARRIGLGDINNYLAAKNLASRGFPDLPP